MKPIKYKGLSPRTNFYLQNGTGRDTYITYDNGGLVAPNKNAIKIKSFWRDTTNKMSLTSRSFGKLEPVPKLKPKVVQYNCDGSGRDNYVNIDSGGLKNQTGSKSTYGKFIHNLRAYEKSDHLCETVK